MSGKAASVSPFLLILAHLEIITQSLNISMSFAFRIDISSLRNPIELSMGGDDMIDVGERLKQLMDERGMTIYSLAKKSNLSWNTIKNFYSRQTKPTVVTISMLCDGLGITMAQFFDGDGDSVHLTAEQQHLVNRWNTLPAHEKQLLSDLLDVMLANTKA